MVEGDERLLRHIMCVVGGGCVCVCVCVCEEMGAKRLSSPLSSFTSPVCGEGGLDASHVCGGGRTDGWTNINGSARLVQ